MSDLADAGQLAAWLAHAAAGDHEAFAMLYRRTAPKLFAVAMRTTGSRDLAEEVVQEAFTAIWQTASRYDRQRGAPMAWLTTVVRHVAIDRLRRGAARGEGRAAPEDALLHLAAGDASAPTGP